MSIKKKKKFFDSICLRGHKVYGGASRPEATHPRLPPAVPGTWARLPGEAFGTPPLPGARWEGGRGRRKPARAGPTAPAEPAPKARGARSAPEGRVVEEGRPEPQSANTNSARRPGRSQEGNGSPCVSLPCTHQPAHSPEEAESVNQKSVHVTPSKSTGRRPSDSRPRLRRGVPPAVCLPPPPPGGQPPAPQSLSFFPLRHFRTYSLVSRRPLITAE